MLALKSNVAGIIICPTQKSNKDINFLKAKMTPFVLLARRFDDETLDYVVIDDVKGGYLATKHLIERGHKEILFINGPLYISSAKERLLGYKEALKNGNIKYNDNLVKEIKITAGNATKLLEKIIKQNIKYTAVFAFDDLIAWEVISFFQKNKIRVPQDIAVVGYDNIQSRFFFPYPLTTINYSKKKMAYEAADLLFNKINGHSEEGPIHIFQETQLIIRNST
jgi:LacI family transcriptional regulator